MEIEKPKAIETSHEEKTITVNVCKELLAKQSAYFCKQLETVREEIMRNMEHEFTELLGEISTTNKRLDRVWGQAELAFTRATENTKLIIDLKMKVTFLEELLCKSEEKCEALDYELKYQHEKSINRVLASWC